MSRWLAAKEIRNLLNNPTTRMSTTEALLSYIGNCRTESEVAEVLTIVFLASPDARPARTTLESCINCPSILADIILQRTYGAGCATGRWLKAHSGRAPTDFKKGKYFEKHQTSHVPPILVNNLSKLEHDSGCAFLEHWAYEWQILRDKLGTRYTTYPHYFDDVIEARAGIVGQYWQRMREIYLSAYLRTLAYAVSEWKMPQRIAESYSIELVHGIAGLFDVEPTDRPEWLSNLPERFCALNADFTSLVHDLVHAGQMNKMHLVSLSTPVASHVKKYARLSLSTYLVTPDFVPQEGEILYETPLVMPVTDTFELKGSPSSISIEEAKTEGSTGDAVAVCGTLMPIPFGMWHIDYLSMGIRSPAPYIIADGVIQCSKQGFEYLTSTGRTVSITQLWNHAWVPSHPRGSCTRSGTATMLDHDLIVEAIERLGRKLAFFVKLSIWDQKKEYGTYEESVFTIFLLT